MTKIEPRYYQIECRDACLDAIRRGVTRLYYVQPTGTGKTVVICMLVDALSVPCRPVVVIAHRDELVSQARAALLRWNPALRVDIEKAGEHATPGCDVIVSSVQSIGRKDSKRLRWLVEAGGPAAIIVDEVHHFTVGSGYDRAVQQLTWSDVSIPVIGCTATDARTDLLALAGRKGAPLQVKAYEYPIQKAIADKNICEIHAFRVASGVDISAVKTTSGDYDAAALEMAVNVEMRTAKAIEHWEETCAERQTIVFCAGVAHAHAAAAAWEDRGYRAAAVWGEMPAEDRKYTLSAHAAGEIQVLTNVGVLTEGYDDPAVSSVVLLRPTKSWSLFAQMIGRGTRPNKPGAHADLIVMDVVDSVRTHPLNQKPDAWRVKKPRDLQRAITVAGMLGMSDDIDLEGHSVTECVLLAESLKEQAALFRDMQPESYSQIQTLLAQVELFSGITTAETAGRVDSVNRWIEDPSGTWKLNPFRGKSITLKQSARGEWWYRLENQTRGPEDGDAVSIANLNTTNLQLAVNRADGIAEIEFPQDMHLVRVYAAWNNQPPTEKQVALLVRFGIEESVASRMSRGEASAAISKRFGR